MRVIHDLWTLTPAPPDNARIPVANATLRSLLIRRGVSDADSFRRFVAPAIGDLHDPANIHGMTHACAPMARARASPAAAGPMRIRSAASWPLRSATFTTRRPFTE